MGSHYVIAIILGILKTVKMTEPLNIDGTDIKYDMF